jgi:hypothetical protein
MVRVAAVIYVLVGATFAAFLVALASGASWAKLTAGRVPSGALAAGGDRLMALLAAVSHVFFVGAVATSAGLMWPQYSAASRSLLWIVAFYDGLATIVQAISRNWARRVWLPACLVLTCCVIVVIIGVK